MEIISKLATTVAVMAARLHNAGFDSAQSVSNSYHVLAAPAHSVRVHSAAGKSRPVTYARSNAATAKRAARKRRNVRVCNGGRS